MAVSTEHTKDILMGDGVNIKFPFTFQVIDKKQIRCLKVLSSGEEIEVLNTEFDVNLNNNGANGGEITFPLVGEPLAEGIKFIIHRQTAIKQDYTPPNGQVFDAVAIKNEIDRLTMQNQEQEENIERAVKTSMGSDTKPEEYLDNVNEMLSNARKLQEETVSVTIKNLEEVDAQVKITVEKASQATEQAKISTQKADDAVKEADRAEYWANNAEIQPNSACQNMVIMDSAVIHYQDDIAIYQRHVVAGDVFSIDLSQRKEIGNFIAFELILFMPVAVNFDLSQILPFGEGDTPDDNKKWLNKSSPDLSEPGEHWIVLFSKDKGTTWQATYEGPLKL